jgi:hypothetical protein
MWNKDKIWLYVDMVKGMITVKTGFNGIMGDKFHETLGKEKQILKRVHSKLKVNGYSYTIRRYGSQCHDFVSRYRVYRIGE